MPIMKLKYFNLVFLILAVIILVVTVVVGYSVTEDCLLEYAMYYPSGEPIPPPYYCARSTYYMGLWTALALITYVLLYSLIFLVIRKYKS